MACPHILADGLGVVLLPVLPEWPALIYLIIGLVVSLLPVLPEWPHILGDRPLDCLVSVPAKLACLHVWLSASIFPICLFLPVSPALMLGNWTLTCLDACPRLWRTANLPVTVRVICPYTFLSASLPSYIKSGRVTSGLPIAACFYQRHLPLFIKIDRTNLFAKTFHLREIQY
jgi:hypothetical protein